MTEKDWDQFSLEKMKAIMRYMNDAVKMHSIIYSITTSFGNEHMFTCNEVQDFIKRHPENVAKDMNDIRRFYEQFVQDYNSGLNHAIQDSDYENKRVLNMIEELKKAKEQDITPIR